MAAGDPVADGGAPIAREMDDDPVLEIGPPADPDRLDVGAEHAAIPNAALLSDGNVAEDDGAGGDKRAWSDVWGGAEMAANRVLHGGNGYVVNKKAGVFGRFFGEKCEILARLIIFMLVGALRNGRADLKEKPMNKGELVEAVQKALGKDTSKRAAEDAVNAVLEAVAKGVKKDGNVQLIGFGTFKVKKRAARMGRNPKTGAAMQIKASKTVGFTPSSALKGSL